MKPEQWHCSTCSYIATSCADYKAHKATHAVRGERHDPTAQPGALVVVPIPELWHRASQIRSIVVKHSWDEIYQRQHEIYKG
jgi:hypothetical protein